MIEFRNVSKGFNGRLVLKNLSFSVEEQSLIGLVGPSGVGKSVLLKLLGNIIQPDAGTIQRGDDARIGFLFQEGALFDSITVLENVAFPLLDSGGQMRLKRSGQDGAKDRTTREEALERAYRVLEQVGLRRAALKYPGQLSGGMRRRVGIARAVVSRPDIVLLDDPTGGLDPVAASVIIELIKKLYSDYYPSVIMVSHDIRRLLPNVDRVLALFDGHIVCDLAPRSLRDEAPSEVVHFLATRFDFDSLGPSASGN